MLLNLSNHPSSKWSTAQKQIALEQYGTIKDIPFPNIPPEYDNVAVKKMANAYFEKIIRLQPKAVHLMGEMTFTYTLVKQLKANKIICIAATTERLVVEKGDKRIVQFNFFRFRKY